MKGTIPKAPLLLRKAMGRLFHVPHPAPWPHAAAERAGLPDAEHPNSGQLRVGPRLCAACVPGSGCPGGSTTV